MVVLTGSMGRTGLDGVATSGRRSGGALLRRLGGVGAGRSRCNDRASADSAVARYFACWNVCAAMSMCRASRGPSTIDRLGRHLGSSSLHVLI